VPLPFVSDFVAAGAAGSGFAVSVLAASLFVSVLLFVSVEELLAPAFEEP